MPEADSPTREQVEVWMREHVSDFDSSLLLAREASKRFARWHHTNVLQDMARSAWNHMQQEEYGNDWF